MGKREARIERNAARELARQEKSARLRERPGFTPEVRVGADPSSIFQMQMTWSCEAPDREGFWASGASRDWSEQDWASVEPKLLEWAKLTWAELDRPNTSSGHKMHHLMAVEVICDDAQLRLMELEQEVETLFRFRLGNKPRLWGTRIAAHFEIIWFDRAHDVYPTDPE